MNANANAGIPRGAKRQRLSLACTQCRKRKVRCDEGQPRCGNCTSRGDECVTVHPRNPGFEAARRRAKNSIELSESSTSTTIVSSRTEDFNESPDQGVCPDLAYSPTTTSSRVVESPSRLSTNGSISSNTTYPISHTITNQRRGSVTGARRPAITSSPYNSDMITNVDATTHKRKLVGGNTLQSLARYVDHCLEGSAHGSLQRGFVMGIEQAEEGLLSTLGSAPIIPNFPSSTDTDQWISVFLERIYPLCPVFDSTIFNQDVHNFSRRDLRQLSPAEIPVLMLIYSVFALASDEQAASITAPGSTYLTAAYGLYGYVVSMPYRSSVQALILLTFALRGRHKEGAAWQVLGQAIRIAQSVGLHRQHLNDGMAESHGERLNARIWWVCYCLEMTMGLEVGRPLSIRNSDCDQPLPILSVCGNGKDFLKLWIGLARIQNLLIEVIYHRSPRTRNAKSLLEDIGRIDQLLCEWESSIKPDEIRPSLDLLCPPQSLHLATFLATNYYQTMITLHQAAFMLDTQTYQATVDDHCRESPLYARLSGSEKILINSARRMANLQLDLSDKHLESRLFTASQSLFVVLILSLNIIKHPSERRVYSDLELLKSSSKYAEDAYTSAGMHPGFINGIVNLRNQMSSKVLGKHSSESAERTSSFTGTNTTEPQYSTASDTRIGYVDAIHTDHWIGEVAQESFWSLNILEDPWRWLTTEGEDSEIQDLTAEL
ncbi:hypothetical protein ACMFMG_011856 [Clarireedia jacksonii]